jgi:predicted molibdopterin-dependent oxidoreductase YjgC
MPEHPGFEPDVVLPVANTAEEEGTFVNRDRRVQRYHQAKPAPGMTRPAWWVLGELVAATGNGPAPAGAPDAFAQLADAVDAFAGLSYAALGFAGHPLARRRRASSARDRRT